MSSTTLLKAPAPAPVAVAESCERIVSFSRAAIAEFAHLTGDANPLHYDAEAAARAHHGRIIASGQHTTSHLIGLAATHFARECEHHVREVLCLNFNFAFKAPVFADDPVALSWTVSAVDWQPRLEGWLAHTDGRAVSHGRVCVVGRGTLLVKARPLPR
jgi:acyl dehydratase